MLATALSHNLQLAWGTLKSKKTCLRMQVWNWMQTLKLTYLVVCHSEKQKVVSISVIHTNRGVNDGGTTEGGDCAYC